MFTIFLPSGTVAGLLMSPDSLKSCFSLLLENCRIFILVLHSWSLRCWNLTGLFIHFYRDTGSINNVINSPGAKLLQDRNRTNLNVNSRACHPQTCLWVSSCGAQLGQREEVSMCAAFSSADSFSPHQKLRNRKVFRDCFKDRRDGVLQLKVLAVAPEYPIVHVSGYSKSALPVMCHVTNSPSFSLFKFFLFLLLTRRFSHLHGTLWQSSTEKWFVFPVGIQTRFTEMTAVAIGWGVARPENSWGLQWMLDQMWANSALSHFITHQSVIVVDFAWTLTLGSLKLVCSFEIEQCDPCFSKHRSHSFSTGRRSGSLNKCFFLK